MLQFKVLYAGEGESRKPDENATPPVVNDSEKVQTIIMKVRMLFLSLSRPLTLLSLSLHI